jgi:1-pyrroline-5-carboxylate dehydrogenase
VFAVTPFNFTAIAGNLASAPALMGNTIVWKPASSAVYSAYHLMQLYKAAGLPDGVINFVPGPGKVVGDIVMASPDLSGVHFTGSTATFQSLWSTAGNNLRNYKSYPRLVGETGGKDFVFAHPSADVRLWLWRWYAGLSNIRVRSARPRLGRTSPPACGPGSRTSCWR